MAGYTYTDDQIQTYEEPAQTAHYAEQAHHWERQAAYWKNRAQSAERRMLQHDCQEGH